MQEDPNSIPRETSVAGPDRPDDRQGHTGCRPPYLPPSGAQLVFPKYFHFARLSKGGHLSCTLWSSPAICSQYLNTYLFFSAYAPIPNFGFLWSCVMNVGWRERKQQNATNFYLNMLQASLCTSSGEQDWVLLHVVFCTGFSGCGCVELGHKLCALCEGLPFNSVLCSNCGSTATVLSSTCGDRETALYCTYGMRATVSACNRRRCSHLLAFDGWNFQAKGSQQYLSMQSVGLRAPSVELAGLSEVWDFVAYYTPQKKNTASQL